MMHAGVFLRGVQAAPPVGEGTVTVTPDGLILRGQAVRTTLATLLSGALASAAMVLAVVAMMMTLGRGESLEPVVAVGSAALVATFTLLRWVAVRMMPTRLFEGFIPYRYIVSAGVTRGSVLMVSTHRPCCGRIAFRTVHTDELVEQVQRAKAAAWPPCSG